jgi:hypothetical protein
MSDVCSICLEELNEHNVVKLSCNHIFHKKCINDALYVHIDLDSIKTCPYCRNELNNNDKKNIITGEQFTEEIYSITENMEWVDAYNYVLEMTYNYIDTGITPDEVFQVIVGWRDTLYTELFEQNDDEENHGDEDIDKYNNMIDKCIEHFVFEKPKMKKYD